MTTLTEHYRNTQASARQALTDLQQMLDMTDRTRRDLETTLTRAQREAALVEFADKAALKEFLAKPYLIRPLGDGQYELAVPTFIGFRAGWPLRHDGAYSIFRVSKFIHFINPLPEWLAQELDFGRPSFLAALEGNVLTITEGDAGAAFDKLGGSKTIARRDGDKLYLRPASRFQILRRIIRDEGFLPYTPQPVPAELRRPPQIAVTDKGQPAFSLRPHQARDYERFLEMGAISVFAYPQTGKSYLPLFASAALVGPKLILAPRRALVDQWRARLELYLTPEAAAEVVVDTYQGAAKHLDKEWTLFVADEAHHAPADFMIETAARIRAVARQGLSATPRREDGNEDLIPALCGFPLGGDWPVSDAQRPHVTVWIVKDEPAKLRLMARLCEKPADGKTFIFTRLLDIGRQAADRLGVPFVHGKTKRPLEVIRDNETVVISSIGNEGLSFPVRRVIEIDFLYGSGMEAGQRLGRLAYEIEGKHHPGEHHVLMTAAEYQKYGKRLLIYEQWGLDLDVRAMDESVARSAARPESATGQGIGMRRSSARSRRAVQPAKPARKSAKPKDEIDEVLLLPAVVAKLEKAAGEPGVNRHNGLADLRRVFRMCYGAELSAKDVAETLGLSNNRRSELAGVFRALAKTGLLTPTSDDRAVVNHKEIKRLQALSKAVR